MGNAASAQNKPNALKTLFKSNYALGLSKAELDERCRPSGLYSSCHWEDKTIRRLIGDGKLGARLEGSEERASCCDRECPICFLNYTEINVTKCCHANICTECYLQVQPQKLDKQSSYTSKKAPQNNCPFCNAAKFQVRVARKDENTSENELKEEAKSGSIPIKRGDGDGRVTPPPYPERPEANPKGTSTPTSGFGSSLEQNERVAMMRARSSSLSETNSHHKSPAQDKISHLAMTPEERKSLENEMRAQHTHPLTMRLEQQEAERRMRNEMEYYQRAHTQNRNVQNVVGLTNPTHRLLSRGQQTPLNRGGRDWNQIIAAFENRGAGGAQPLGDESVLESAMMLSMQEDSQQRGESPMPSSAASRPSSFDVAPPSIGVFPARPYAGNSSNLPFPQTNESETASHGYRAMTEEAQIALAIAESLKTGASQTQAGSEDIEGR